MSGNPVLYGPAWSSRYEVPSWPVYEVARSGIVDFEFSGPDLRAADLACAIYITVVRSSEAERWPAIEALVAGYRRALALDPIEAAAS